MSKKRTSRENGKRPRRNNRRRRTLIVLLVLAIGYLAGPRISTDVTMAARPAAAAIGVGELEGFLRESEGRFGDDIVKETEKQIVWHGEPGTRTPVAVVFLHGFSGSHATLDPLPQEVANSLQANLFCTRYAGHGRKDTAGYGAPLGEATLQQWVDDTREAVAIGRQLGERVVVIANSTAAPLATWVAGEGEAPDVLVLMSPNFGLQNPLSGVVAGPWGRQILRLAKGERYASKGHRTPAHKHVSTTEYPSRAIMTLLAAVKLGREAKFDRIEIPALCLYSARDQVIVIDDALEYFGRFKSPAKRLQEVTTSTHHEQHALAGKFMSPGSTGDVRDMIVDYVRDTQPAVAAPKP